MKAIKIHPEDNVATLINDVEQGDGVVIVSSDGETILRLVAKNSIPLGHKLALEKIEPDSDVIKYGETIGRTVEAIEEGTHVHVHNVQSRRVR